MGPASKNPEIRLPSEIEWSKRFQGLSFFPSPHSVYCVGFILSLVLFISWGFLLLYSCSIRTRLSYRFSITYWQSLKLVFLKCHAHHWTNYFFQNLLFGAEIETSSLNHMDYQKELGIIGMGKGRCNMVLGMNKKQKSPLNLSDRFLKAKNSYLEMIIQDSNRPCMVSLFAVMLCWYLSYLKMCWLFVCSSYANLITSFTNCFIFPYVKYPRIYNSPKHKL